MTELETELLMTVCNKKADEATVERISSQLKYI